ncbi:MAG TPA: hypothetical protein VFE47_11465 [Tepidisphaeraceae bacterium]|nr:hypothetical protein [Tepidisphaeraceae bacterium]
MRIDKKGFITSITSRDSGKEYSPASHPSPLLSLHEDKQPNDHLVLPASAIFHDQEQTVELKYPNGATAVVKVAAKEDYFRFQLVSLTRRGNVDNIVWGPVHTTIRGKIGDLIGVVRDDDWAIGLYGLDDNTIAGPVVDSDCYQMGYYIHSPDPAKYPVPAKYKEGQWFSVGGDGVSDTAFYSHPEEYFQQVFGTGAKLEPEFGSTVAYHARDRRKSYTYFYSLLPGFERSRLRHQVSDPVEGVDFINSGVALYACPDDQGLATIEKIQLGEGLPHITINGKWIRDPSTFGVTLNWSGPYDKCIEYAEALGVKDISRETGEFYMCRGNNWSAGNVGFANRPPMPFKEFTEEAHKQGLSNGGLHTLCVFLQGGISHDVTPIPSEHLQTVCRTKLARDISATDTEIVVTDPSFLAEKGTWPEGDNSNYLQIGGEMLRYEGISESAPWTLKGVKRGHASKALAHKAGDELVKLQQNCYNGFVPDIKLLPECADYYADLMYRNGMDAINFDGFESTIYQNQGYYGTRIFCRRLFETYARLTGGKTPRVTSSNIFAGSWEYLNACNVGGGNNMFNPGTGRRGTEGKDIGNGFSNSYYPATFGVQGWHSDWSLYDAENLQAKAVGWDATYALSVSQDAIDKTGEKEAIFKAFHVWQDARAAGAFTKAQKEKLRDPNFKFHLEADGKQSFILHPINELQIAGKPNGDAVEFHLVNSFGSQPLQFSLQLADSTDGITITLPDGSRLKSDKKMDAGQLIVCKGKQAYLADGLRRKISDLAMNRAAVLPNGESTVGVELHSRSKAAMGLTVWISGKAEEVRPSKSPNQDGKQISDANRDSRLIRCCRDICVNR